MSMTDRPHRTQLPEGTTASSTLMFKRIRFLLRPLASHRVHLGADPFWFVRTLDRSWPPVPIDPLACACGAALLRDRRGRLSAGQVSSARRSRERRTSNPDIGVPAALALKGDDLDAVTAIVGVNDHQRLPNSSGSKA